MSQYTFKTRYLRIAPRKVRSVADLVRGLPVNEAEAQLSIERRRAAGPILKLIRSGKAGVKDRKGNVDSLVIKTIQVDEGPMLKRYLPRARGAASPLQKKSSHITLTLSESDTVVKQRFNMELPEKEKKAPKKQPKRASKVADKRGDDKKKTSKGKGFFKKTFGRRSDGGE